MSEHAKLDVIVAGDLFVDLIMSGFPFWPGPGQEAFATEYCREIGGGVAITACGLAKLGSKAGVLAVVGSDVGSWVVDGLRSRGVDVSAICFDPDQPTAFSVAVSSPQDRAFFTYAGANARFPDILRQTAATGGLSHARHVHLGFAPNLQNVSELLAAIRSNGCTVSLDIGWHESWLCDPRAMDVVRALDLFFPNEREAACMTGESDAEAMLRVFAERGLNTVALKLGTRGAALLWDGQITMAEPYEAVPVDTTGAGDAFDAGFLHGWAAGQPPEVCLRIGNFCGALSTEALGGIKGFPTREQLDQALRITPASTS